MMSNYVFGFLLTSIVSASKVFPPGRCSLDDRACEIHETNLLMSVTGVSTVEECRQICYDRGDCAYMSYFGHNSFPFSEVCMLFSNCSSQHPCQDCVTEDRFCYNTCSDNIEGPLGENIVETIPDIENELICKMKCNNITECNFYTYHNGSDPNYPNMCILLTDIQEPLQTCNFCSTGAAECSFGSICSFLDDDGFLTMEDNLFTDTSIPVSVRTISVGRCQLTILGIGGGGNGGDQTSGSQRSGGGGRSGEVSLLSYFSEKSTELVINVGGPNKPSTVVTVEGEMVLVAQPGANGESLDGGNGYSGGGGDGHQRAGSGGSDGGDGVSGSEGVGGEGSGVNISTFELERFTISPGAGGKPTCGGGGGGLLINGTGPPILSGRGLGYGGGGEGCNTKNYIGSPGAILMEMKKKSIPVY